VPRIGCVINEMQWHVEVDRSGNCMPMEMRYVARPPRCVLMCASPTLVKISRTQLRRHGDAHVQWHLAHCGKTLFSND